MTVLLMLVGLPGCGKSTFAADINARLQSAGLPTLFRVCQDVLRSKDKCLATTRAALWRGTGVIVDRTNLTWNQRRPFYEIAAACPNATRLAIYFDLSPRKCQARVLGRPSHEGGLDRRMSPDAVDEIFCRLRNPPGCDDGHGADSESARVADPEFHQEWRISEEREAADRAKAMEALLSFATLAAAHRAELPGSSLGAVAENESGDDETATPEGPATKRRRRTTQSSGAAEPSASGPDSVVATQSSTELECSLWRPPAPGGSCAARANSGDVAGSSSTEGHASADTSRDARIRASQAHTDGDGAASGSSRGSSPGRHVLLLPTDNRHGTYSPGYQDCDGDEDDCGSSSDSSFM